MDPVSSPAVTVGFADVDDILTFSVAPNEDVTEALPEADTTDLLPFKAYRSAPLLLAFYAAGAAACIGMTAAHAPLPNPAVTAHHSETHADAAIHIASLSESLADETYHRMRFTSLYQERLLHAGISPQLWGDALSGSTASLSAAKASDASRLMWSADMLDVVLRVYTTTSTGTGGPAEGSSRHEASLLLASRLAEADPVFAATAVDPEGLNATLWGSATALLGAMFETEIYRRRAAAMALPGMALPVTPEVLARLRGGAAYISPALRRAVLAECAGIAESLSHLSLRSLGGSGTGNGGTGGGLPAAQLAGHLLGQLRLGTAGWAAQGGNATSPHPAGATEGVVRLGWGTSPLPLHRARTAALALVGLAGGHPGVLPDSALGAWQVLSGVGGGGAASLPLPSQGLPPSTPGSLAQALQELQQQGAERRAAAALPQQSLGMLEGVASELRGGALSALRGHEVDARRAVARWVALPVVVAAFLLIVLSTILAFHKRNMYEFHLRCDFCQSESTEKLISKYCKRLESWDRLAGSDSDSDDIDSPVPTSPRVNLTAPDGGAADSHPPPISLPSPPQQQQDQEARSGSGNSTPPTTIGNGWYPVVTVQDAELGGGGGGGDDDPASPSASAGGGTARKVPVASSDWALAVGGPFREDGGGALATFKSVDLFLPENTDEPEKDKTPKKRKKGRKKGAAGEEGSDRKGASMVGGQSLRSTALGVSTSQRGTASAPKFEEDTHDMQRHFYTALCVLQHLRPFLPLWVFGDGRDLDVKVTGGTSNSAVPNVPLSPTSASPPGADLVSVPTATATPSMSPRGGEQALDQSGLCTSLNPNGGCTKRRTSRLVSCVGDTAPIPRGSIASSAGSGMTSSATYEDCIAPRVFKTPLKLEDGVRVEQTNSCLAYVSTRTYLQAAFCEELHTDYVGELLHNVCSIAEGKYGGALLDVQPLGILLRFSNEMDACLAAVEIDKFSIGQTLKRNTEGAHEPRLCCDTTPTLNPLTVSVVRSKFTTGALSTGILKTYFVGGDGIRQMMLIDRLGSAIGVRVLCSYEVAKRVIAQGGKALKTEPAGAIVRMQPAGPAEGGSSRQAGRQSGSRVATLQVVFEVFTKAVKMAGVLEDSISGRSNGSKALGNEDGTKQDYLNVFHSIKRGQYATATTQLEEYLEQAHLRDPDSGRVTCPKSAFLYSTLRRHLKLDTPASQV